MAYTYNDCKTARDEISAGILANKKRVEQSKAAINTAVGDLNGMTAKYAPFIDAINADALANQDDIAYQMAKSESDKLVGEFLDLLAEAQAVQAAIAAVG